MKVAEAAAQGVTIFSSSVTTAPFSHRTGKPTKVLKEAKENHKMGGANKDVNTWLKGPFKGKRLFTLTLEERATCDETCSLWNSCYGNNMPFATRWNPGKELEDTIAREVVELLARYPSGISIRLHVLGDFYSVSYVNFWLQLLEAHPTLDVYGYTHRTGAIHDAIDRGWNTYKARFNIMQSGGTPNDIRPIANVIGFENEYKLPICPVESGKLHTCLECGLCTNPNIKGIAFIEH